MSGPAAVIVIVMGVSGSGKTTLGQALAVHNGFRFLDADDFHPPANVEKMRSGVALDDADRAPWLARLAACLANAAKHGEETVLACSALKARYRAALAVPGADVLFVHLQGDPVVLAARMAERKDHYMPPSLLRTQLATLEPPNPDPTVLTLDCSRPVEALREAVMERLRARMSGPKGPPATHV